MYKVFAPHENRGKKHALCRSINRKKKNHFPNPLFPWENFPSPSLRKKKFDKKRGDVVVYKGKKEKSICSPREEEKTPRKTQVSFSQPILYLFPNQP